jgi:hypothetical protein
LQHGLFSLIGLLPAIEAFAIWALFFRSGARALACGGGIRQQERPR